MKANGRGTPDQKLYLLAQFDPRTNRRFARMDQKLCGAGLAGEQTRGIPPHFSLASFEIERLDEVPDLLERCADVRRFAVEFSHLGLFSGGRVLFLAPSQSKELISLYERVNEKSLWAGEPFAAHATLYIGPENTALKALSLAAEGFKPFRATVERVSLYAFFPARLIGSTDLR